MSGPEFFPPSLGLKKMSTVLYADDMVLLSLTQIGLKRLLFKLSDFCKEKSLSINYAKTKMMVFEERPSKFQQSIDSAPIDQYKNI